MSQLASPSPAPRSSGGGTAASGTRCDAHAALVAPPSAALPAVQPAALASGSGLQPERSSRSAADSPAGAATLKSDNAAARRSSSVVAETSGSRVCSEAPAAAEAGGRSGRGVVECHACSTPAARRAAACSRLLGLSWPLASRACRRSILRWLEFHRFLIALSVRPGSSLTISHPAHRRGPVVSNGRDYNFEGDCADGGAYIWAPFALPPPRLPGPPPPATRSYPPRARGDCATALGTACPFCPGGPFA